MVSFSFCPGKFGFPFQLLAAAIFALAPAVSRSQGVPVITDISPTFGSPFGGTVVSIFGSNFTNATAVEVGGYPVRNFTVNGPNLIVMTTAALGPGVWTVTVKTPAGLSQPGPFTQAAPPVVTSLSVRSSLPEGGAVITISGRNFAGAIAVHFGSQTTTVFRLNAPSAFTFNTPGEITLTTPPGVAGVVDVRVTTLGGTSEATSADLFSFVPHARFGDASCLGPVTPTRGLDFGFVIAGVSGITKKVLLRGIGASLARFGNFPPLLRPQLTVYDSRGNILAENAGWGDRPEMMAVFDQVGAFALLPGRRDAAVVLDLLPGPYTLAITSADGGSGLALGEVYDADPPATVPVDRIVNFSSFGMVSPDSPLTVGFVVTGDSPKVLLIRAIGPGLAPFGFPAGYLLSDPLLLIYDGNGRLIALNDNWGEPIDSFVLPEVILQASPRAGAFPLNFGSKDAVTMVALPPGNYSAMVVGQFGAGLALVEAYEVPQ